MKSRVMRVEDPCYPRGRFYFFLDSCARLVFLNSVANPTAVEMTPGVFYYYNWNYKLTAVLEA